VLLLQVTRLLSFLFLLSPSFFEFSFFADAATMPLHWVYDQQVVEAKVKIAADAGKGPEFYSPTFCPFYNYTVGRQSPYGDETLPLLTSMVEKGHFDVEDARDCSFQFCRTYDGRLNNITKKFYSSRLTGLDWTECAVADDMQFLALMKLPIIVARYAGSPSLIEKVEAAVRIHQSNDKVLAAARLVAKILEKIILGSSAQEAFKWAKETTTISAEDKAYITDDDNTTLPFSVAADRFGLNGQLPGCLITALYGIEIFRGYEVAIRANMVAAGDNVLRSWLIGSFLAAEQGSLSIPKEWCNQTVMYAKIYDLAEAIVNSNSYLEQKIERGCSLPSLLFS
jgi:hypothetical protein